MRIGKNVFIGDDVYLESEYPELVELLDNTVLSARCVVIAHTRGGGSVTIGPDVLVGIGALIVCPVGKALKIGAGSVISTGSVVSSSVAPATLIAPPRSGAVAKVTVPWMQTGSFEQFVAGIRPLNREREDSEGAKRPSPVPAPTE